MKIILMIYVLLLFSIAVFSQEEKSAHYRYNFNSKEDNFQLQLIDSLVIIKNNKLKIRTITHFTQKDNKISNQVVYLNKHKLDSIHKWFEKDNLVKTEVLNYDKKNRLVKSTESYLSDPKKNTVRIYQYTDSITKDGKISTMKVFRTYADMLYSLDYIIKTYFDKQGDTIRQVRVDRKVETEILNKTKSTIRLDNTIIFKQETSFTEEELKDQSKLIHKYLQLLKEKLNDIKYVWLEYYFIDNENRVQLLIKKNRWKNVQRVEIGIRE